MKREDSKCSSSPPTYKLNKKPTAMEIDMIDKIISTIKKDISIGKQVSNFSRISNNSSSLIYIKSSLRSVPEYLKKKCDWAPVLVVDDQIINRMILVEFGSKNLLKSDEAENGKIAYNMYKASLQKSWCDGYRLIFMDLNMPVLDGIAATAKIMQEATSHTKPRVVAITAFWSEEEKEKYLISEPYESCHIVFDWIFI